LFEGCSRATYGTPLQRRPRRLDDADGYGQPVADAFDGFRRLYDTWLSNGRPDCSELRCLG
jgi:hypothetical protein